MCNQDLEVDPWQPDDVPKHFKTQEMYDDAVWEDPFSLKFIPNWFVSQQQLKLWHYNTDRYDDDEIIGWYKGHGRRKAQKAETKEELLSIAWHPDRVMDRCMSEDEKRL